MIIILVIVLSPIKSSHKQKKIKFSDEQMDTVSADAQLQKPNYCKTAVKKKSNSKSANNKSLDSASKKQKPDVQDQKACTKPGLLKQTQSDLHGKGRKGTAQQPLLNRKKHSAVTHPYSQAPLAPASPSQPKNPPVPVKARKMTNDHQQLQPQQLEEKQQQQKQQRDTGLPKQQPCLPPIAGEESQPIKKHRSTDQHSNVHMNTLDDPCLPTRHSNVYMKTPGDPHLPTRHSNVRMKTTGDPLLPNRHSNVCMKTPGDPRLPTRHSNVHVKTPGYPLLPTRHSNVRMKTPGNPCLPTRHSNVHMKTPGDPRLPTRHSNVRMKTPGDPLLPTRHSNVHAKTPGDPLLPPDDPHLPNRHSNVCMKTPRDPLLPTKQQYHLSHSNRADVPSPSPPPLSSSPPVPSLPTLHPPIPCLSPPVPVLPTQQQDELPPIEFRTDLPPILAFLEEVYNGPTAYASSQSPLSPSPPPNFISYDSVLTYQQNQYLPLSPVELPPLQPLPSTLPHHEHRHSTANPGIQLPPINLNSTAATLGSQKGPSMDTSKRQATHSNTAKELYAANESSAGGLPPLVETSSGRSHRVSVLYVRQGIIIATIHLYTHRFWGTRFV